MNRQQIAEVLKLSRVAADLTQAQVAELIGKKQQTVASWETGQSQPDIDTLFTLCYLYGTTVNEAFGFVRKDESIQEEEMIKKYRALDRHGKEIVDAVLKIEAGRMQDQEKPLLEFVARGGGTLPSGIADPSAIHTDQVRIRDEQTDADERI